MWHRKFESSWLSIQNNFFMVQLPAKVKEFGFLKITCESPQAQTKPIIFTLVENGCTHNLPLTIKNEEFQAYKNFKIIADGFEYKEQYFQIICTITGFPKDLQRPIVKFNSITTVEISHGEEANISFEARYRIKGKEEWINGTKITFESVDEIYECQVFTTLENGANVYSPIIDVTCMWKNYDIESETSLDLEQMIMKKNFWIHFNANSVYNTQYKATMKLISPVDNENYNKETVVAKSDQFGSHRIDYPLIPGAQYEFKIMIKKLNISYTKIIKVPGITLVDHAIWTKLFGEVDLVSFVNMTCRHIESWKDWEAGERDDYDVDYNWRYLTLNRNGFWKLKHDYQFADNCTVEDKGQSVGTFVLSENGSVNAHISLIKVSSSIANKPLTLIVSQSSGSIIQKQVKPALQLHDIIRSISDYCGSYKERQELRLVCKTWYVAIPTTYHGTISAKSGRVFDFDFNFEESTEREKREGKPKA